MESFSAPDRCAWLIPDVHTSSNIILQPSSRVLGAIMKVRRWASFPHLAIMTTSLAQILHWSQHGSEDATDTHSSSGSGEEIFQAQLATFVLLVAILELRTKKKNKAKFKQRNPYFLRSRMKMKVGSHRVQNISGGLFPQLQAAVVCVLERDSSAAAQKTLEPAVEPRLSLVATDSQTPSHLPASALQVLKLQTAPAISGLIAEPLPLQKNLPDFYDV